MRWPTRKMSMLRVKLKKSQVSFQKQLKMNLDWALCRSSVNVCLVSLQMTFYYFSILIRHALSRFLLSSRITFSLLQIGTCFLFSFLQKSFLLIQAFNDGIITGITQQRTEGTQVVFECKSIWLNLFSGGRFVR